MRLFAVASICLTVQSMRSPGDGCCWGNPNPHGHLTNGFSLTQSYPLHLDEVYDSIPEGVRCEEEISGTEAVQREGSMYQSFSANCMMDQDITTYRSVDWNLANGSYGSASIIYYANGTVEADCRMGILSSSDNPGCFGPKSDDDTVFVGNVSYGSLQAERYKINNAECKYNKAQCGWMKNAFLDIDVDNGCIPIRMGPMTVTNFVNADPPDSLFVIPHECTGFQHGATATSPVTHPKGFLRFLKPVRTSVV